MVWLASKPRERYKVAYPGYETCTLNIITENLSLARRGDVQMQASLAWQYFKALGHVQPPGWDWARFSFTATGEAGRPPRSRAKKVETYGCTCTRDNCGSCDQGHHGSCRECQFGQPVK